MAKLTGNRDSKKSMASTATVSYGVSDGMSRRGKLSNRVLNLNFAMVLLSSHGTPWEVNNGTRVKIATGLPWAPVGNLPLAHLIREGKH